MRKQADGTYRSRTNSGPGLASAAAAPEARTPKSLMRGVASLPGAAGASLSRATPAYGPGGYSYGAEEKEQVTARDAIRGFGQLPSSVADAGAGPSGESGGLAPAAGAAGGGGPPPTAGMSIPPPILISGASSSPSFSAGSGNRRRGSSGSSASSGDSAPSTPRSSHRGERGHTPDNSGRGGGLPRPSTPKGSPLASAPPASAVAPSTSTVGVAPAGSLGAQTYEYKAQDDSADGDEYYEQQLEQQGQVGLHLTPEREEAVRARAPAPGVMPGLSTPGSSNSSRPGSAKKSPAAGSGPPIPTMSGGGGGGSGGKGGPPPSSLHAASSSSGGGSNAPARAAVLNPYSNRSLQATYGAFGAPTAAPPMGKIHTFDPSKFGGGNASSSPAAATTTTTTTAAAAAATTTTQEVAGSPSASAGTSASPESGSAVAPAAAREGAATAGTQKKGAKTEKGEAASVSAAAAAAATADADAAEDEYEPADFPDPMQMQLQMQPPSPDSSSGSKFMGGGGLPVGLTKVASFSAPPVHRPVYAPTPMPHDPPEKKRAEENGGAAGVEADEKASNVAKARQMVRSREKESRQLAAAAASGTYGVRGAGTDLLVRFLVLVNYLMTLGILATVVGLLALFVALHPPSEQEISLVQGGAAGLYEVSVEALRSLLDMLPLPKQMSL